MRFIRLLLLPFSLLYGFIIIVRNFCYQKGILKSHIFNIPIISVGNLEVGGSGKTPMVVFIIQLLKYEYNIATLSRGYGRKSKGFKLVNANDDVLLVGDEPLLLKNSFPDIAVAVCEDRVVGVNKLKGNHHLIILDDAYQHRAVKPGFSILLFNYHHLNKWKMMLPTGNYREPFSARKRADLLVITKTPIDISEKEKAQISESIKPFKHQKLIFSTIKYADTLTEIYDKAEIVHTKHILTDTRIFLLTAIANPEPLITHIKKHTSHIIHHQYPDHHPFSLKNILKLVAEYDKCSHHKLIITTQKDAVRLNTEEIRNLLKDFKIYEWPITMGFLANDEEQFKKIINNYVKLI